MEELAQVPARVLVADDDEDARIAIVEALLEDGHHAIGAGDAIEVLSWLETIEEARLRTPALFAIDVHMPGFSGIELVEALRRAGWRTPVILVTAFATDDLRARANEASARVMEKPFEPSSLCALVRELLHP